MTVKKFNLPDVGEGLTEAEIVSWKVKAGDTVAVNDVLCEIETAKSLVELPSPYAGTVTELLVPEGVTVDVGTPIISVSDAAAAEPASAAPPAPAAHVTAPEAATPDEAPMYGTLEPGTLDAADSAGPPAGGPLVGSGPKADAVKRRRRISAPAAAGHEAPSAAPATGAAAPMVERAGVEAHDIWINPDAASSPADAATGPAGSVEARPTFGGAISGLVGKVLAKPPVRKIARDLGINLADVVPTGARGE